MEILQPVIETILTAALTAIVTTAGYYLRQWVKAQIGQRNYEIAGQLVRTAVLSVEQEAQKRGLDSTQKKRLALNRAQKLFDDAKIPLNAEQLSGIVESVVFDELNRWHMLQTTDS